ncbi:hypothetical protein [Luteimonas suaedae]|uniref:hypothetical protein n=1 Tax=Luteimonas suaedae TaxID=2605430 RepID=UPI0011EFAC59|nr:hypothetical protein [Luteimonas suaedae]
MNNVIRLRNMPGPAAPAAGHPDTSGAPSADVRQQRLAAILREVATADGEVLYPLLAALLATHLDAPCDREGDSRIRDRLDELQLLIALEMEREGIRGICGRDVAARACHA